MSSQMILGILIIAGIFGVAGFVAYKLDGSKFETAEKRAGRQGERIATGVIREIIDAQDILLTNIHIMAEGKQTELDNVIINNRGVFIIEVKNYYGELFGKEDDREWIKNKVTASGAAYQTTIKNPIGQVKRQVYILSRYLKEHGIDVWVEGYVFFLESNSPIKSGFVLETQADIDRVIHNGRDNNLNADTVSQIEKCISG